MVEKCRHTRFLLLDYEVSTSEDLNQAFPELASVSRDCKFRSCTHTHEPSCAVKLAVEEGTIATFRFDNYHNSSVRLKIAEKPIKS